MSPELSPLFDALCRTACALFGVPWALIHLDDGTCHGAAPDGGPEGSAGKVAAAFRRQAPLSGQVVVVEDAARDPRFVADPVVAGAPHIRFYAGAPLSPAPDTGTLCLMDTAPRAFTREERRRLEDLARIASAHLHMRVALREASEREALYRLLAENSTDTLVRGDLDGVRLYISPAVRTLLGYEPEELVGRKASEIVHPDDAAKFGTMMQDLKAGRIDFSMIEQRQRHKDGSWVWQEAFIKVTRDGASGRPDGYVVSVRDISRRKEIESRLAHLASHDPLTGLPNRTLLHERLGQEMSRAARTGAGFALLCMDLDRFKQVNDRFGHEAGDAVLRAVAGRLRSAVRAEDTVARMGGDEFVVIQADGGTLSAAAMGLAERLIRAVSEPVDFNGTALNIGLSVGIAVAPIAGADADGLLRAADDALYKAKQAGRNRYCVFNPGT